MTLQRRLTVLAASAVAVAVVLAAIGAYAAVRSELRGQVDDALTTRAEHVNEIAARVMAPLPQEIPHELEAAPGLPAGGIPPAIVGEEPVFLQLISPSGEAVGIRSGETTVPVDEAARSIASAGSGREFADIEAGGDHFRSLTVAFGDQGAIQLAAPLDGVDSVLADLRVILFLISLAGIAVAALVARALAKRVVGPIGELTEAAEHIGATDDLSRRIGVTSEDEVGRLATRFNAMLDGIEASQAALKSSLTAQAQLVADASHELRTPIASLRTDVESLAAHPELDAHQRGRRLAEVEARTEELTALVTDVIELARGDGRAPDAEELRLDEVAAESVAWLHRHVPEREVTTAFEPTVIEGRPDRVGRAINNLLDNAHKYSPPGEPIEVTVAGGELTVRDHGPGISEAERAAIFDRFHRGTDSRDVPGSGLGLAIVRQVAESHGGAVAAEAAPGGGSVFRLAFEQAPAVDG